MTFGILVAGGVSAFYVPLTVLAIRWFGDRRGMAASVVSAGNGAGILLLSPLTRWLVNELDWRTAFLILGDLALARGDSGGVVAAGCAERGRRIGDQASPGTRGRFLGAGRSGPSR